MWIESWVLYNPDSVDLSVQLFLQSSFILNKSCWTSMGIVEIWGAYHPSISVKICDIITQNGWGLLNLELWKSPTKKPI